jgi:plastocyanin
MRSSLYLAVLLAACGSDPAPPVTDAPISTIDAPIDAAVDAPAPLTINGCTAAMAVDLTASGATRTVVITDDVYTPKCAKIQVGQSITWSGNFNDHPLAGGIIRGASVETQPGSPIPSVTNGAMRTVVFSTAGDWAYYCPNHSPGMAGVIYVVP